MDAKEIESFAALAEESSKTDKSCGLLFDVAVRDPATIFRHDLGCSGRTVLNCNCSFARMNFDEMISLESASQSGLDVRNPQETVRISLAARENQILSNVASFFGLVTEARAGKLPLPKPLSALRMMTTGDEAGRGFWGPSGIWTKFLASTRTAVTELRALVARQAAAILRLLSHLANLGGGGAAPMAIAADAPGGAPPALNPPSLPDAAAKPPPRAEPPPAPAAQAPDCSGGDLTLDQVRPLLRAALKIPKPRSQQPTIGGGLDRSTLFRRRQNCAPMTDLWMDNCGFATNETEPARIVAASLDPKVLSAAGRMVAGRRTLLDRIQAGGGIRNLDGTARRLAIHVPA